MWMNMNLNMFYFLMSCLMFTSFYKHILVTLISMEFMLINLFMNLFSIMINLNINIYLMTMFIGISVCESVLGLSILVYMIRNSGNDYSKTLYLMKW
uniref:NADH-ubiquinone oxidoreductase chain 4L n=1 Tax=Diachasmimorpha longicaudata TaxID=58733 RepID=D8WHC2_9HYME|nr:NADH dehydrogenase subunit 4L [Diachasmimorpha longicaudata]